MEADQVDGEPDLDSGGAAHLDRAFQTTPFYPIAGQRAAEEVVDEIAVAIRSGIYRPGDRLPTIQQLAELTHVSKPTVGEAIRILAREGVVKAYRGATGGTVVASSDIPSSMFRVPGAGQEISLAELMEARHVIEMQLALLAGERANEQDFRTMRQAVDELRAAVDADHWSEALQADHFFHYVFGRAARSGMLALAQHQILVRLAELFDGYVEHDMQVVVQTHEETLAAIQSRDASSIQDAMNRHLGVLESQEPGESGLDTGIDEQVDSLDPSAT